MPTRKLPPITKPAPPDPPRCPYCRRKLRPRYVWYSRNGQKLALGACLSGSPSVREFDQWGVDGTFCSMAHGYLFAKRVVQMVKSGRWRLTDVLNPFSTVKTSGVAS